jgi:hypothetical protein
LNIVPYKHGARLSGWRFVVVTRMRRNPIMPPKNHGIVDTIDIDALSATAAVTTNDHPVNLHIAGKKPVRGLALHLSPLLIILLVGAFPLLDQIVEEST